MLCRYDVGDMRWRKIESWRHSQNGVNQLNISRCHDRHSFPHFSLFPLVACRCSSHIGINFMTYGICICYEPKSKNATTYPIFRYLYLDTYWYFKEVTRSLCSQRVCTLHQLVLKSPSGNMKNIPCIYKVEAYLFYPCLSME